MTTAKQKITEVRIEDLEIDQAVSIRSAFLAINPEVVERYAEALDELPPVTVFQVNGSKILTDGFHRVQAHKNMGSETIRAYVLSGTKDDALAHAAIANTRHGRSLTVPEYRDAVARLDLPLIKPHPHPVRLQPVRHVADDVLVLLAMAEEDVVFEVAHWICHKKHKNAQRRRS